MNGHCGGCRARAYGMTGDLMAEDPLCTHTPGTFAGSPLLAVRAAAASAARRARRSAAIEYGPESPTTIAWDDAAAARMKKIPAFVRGMVVRAVEESCRKNGLDRVTVEELERIRARMPTPKMFGVSRLAALIRGGGRMDRRTWTSVCHPTLKSARQSPFICCSVHSVNPASRRPPDGCRVRFAIALALFRPSTSGTPRRSGR